MPVQRFNVTTTREFSQSYDHTYTPGTAGPINTSIDADTVLLTALVANSDVIAHSVQLVSLGFFPQVVIASASVPAGAGQGSSPTIDLIAVLLGANNSGLPVPPSTSLAFAVGEAITAGGVSCFSLVGQA